MAVNLARFAASQAAAAVGLIVRALRFDLDLPAESGPLGRTHVDALRAAGDLVVLLEAPVTSGGPPGGGMNISDQGRSAWPW